VVRVGAAQLDGEFGDEGIRRDQFLPHGQTLFESDAASLSRFISW